MITNWLGRTEQTPDAPDGDPPDPAVNATKEWVAATVAALTPHPFPPLPALPPVAADRDGQLRELALLLDQLGLCREYGGIGAVADQVRRAYAAAATAAAGDVESAIGAAMAR